MTPQAKQIPLRNRQGMPIAWALVDSSDFDRIADRPWCLDAAGYAHRRSRNAPTEYLHRMVLGLDRWSVDGREVDHINRNKLDNRRANLRIVERRENGQNLPSHPNSTSRFRGVYWYPQKQRWRARVQVGGRDVFCRTFRTEIDAAIAAEQARQRFMPFAEPDPLLMRTLDL